MAEYVSVPVPFKTKDNQRYLTEFQLYQLPELREFVERFHSCFEHDWLWGVWWYLPE